MNRGVRITTGARLHFGLLDIAAPFGGCGVMIDSPTTIVEASLATEFAYRNPADSDSADQNPASATDQAGRATAIAERIAEQLAMNSRLPPVLVRLIQAAPPHTGLGSGTQLSLAIAEAILHVLQHPVDATPHCRAIWLHAAQRGQRSAVGTHGYQQGGFIAEGLREQPSSPALNSLDTRIELPAAWRVSVLLPAKLNGSQGTVSGEWEQAKFESLPPVSPERRESLKKLLTGSLIPAIENADFEVFCDAVTQYNRSSGLFFARVQGGPYHGEATTQLVAQLLQLGYRGVGQSSWGPGVFTWHPDATSAEKLQQHFRDSHYQVFVAAPQLHGRLLEPILRDS